MFAALGLRPIIRMVYRRMDELQRVLHQQASMNTLSILASDCCLIGILQANQVIPLFNQFWSLGLIIVLWGINLMLADRSYR